jgi:predicted nucleic acid-binding protein
MRRENGSGSANVKVEELISKYSRVFLDTAPVIYYIERHPEYATRVDPIFDALDAGVIEAVTSAVTLSETLVGPFKQGNASLARRFEEMVVRGPGVTFVSINEVIAREAAALRAVKRVHLGDALQLAAAKVSSCDCFLTNDLALSSVGTLAVVSLSNLAQ